MKKIKKIQGRVVEALPNLQFRVDIGLGNDKLMRCYLSGKMNQNRIKIMVGDRVDIEIPDSPSIHLEENIGRIVYRTK